MLFNFMKDQRQALRNESCIFRSEKENQSNYVRELAMTNLQLNADFFRPCFLKP